MAVRFVLHGVVVVVLTLLTQLGGIAWLLALAYRRGNWRFWVAFVLGYVLLLGAAQLAAPLAGRVPLPCGGAPLRMQSAFYCVTMRNFVSPEMQDVAQSAAGTVEAQFPGTVTLALDANFPFLDAFPMLPHLSHGDGDKLDLAFHYADAGGYAPGQTASPIGYFAFERGGEEACPAVWPTLRWDMAWFQPLVRDLTLEPARTAALIRALVADPRVGKVFVEPPLAARLGVAGPKVRFQGCRVARHDDHIHLQL
jgi:hypothetical protein